MDGIDTLKTGRRPPDGDIWIWASAMALTLILLMAVSLLGVIVANGLGVFWPKRLAVAGLKDGTRIMGELVRVEPLPDKSGGVRRQFKVGNRDLYGLDFRWIDDRDIQRLEYPPEALALERREYGNFYGYLKAVSAPDVEGSPDDSVETRFVNGLSAVRERQNDLAALRDRISRLNRRNEALRLRLLKLRYRQTAATPSIQAAALEQATIAQQYEILAAELDRRVSALRSATAVLVDANGREKTVALADVVRPYYPNRMSAPAKGRFFLAKVKELLCTEPRESNTEGGIFPSIFGTVLMVLIMSLLSFPLGVIGGIFLRVYAREGWLVRGVRIAVNNLAGIPSIVFGIFGLGFFVYTVGGTLDHLFFPERLPAPTFGTGGIFWASLTLGLLTAPVVIVATEEALGAIPRGIPEASLALGATRFQTLVRLLLPMASPGIMTGFILAMARAAGEVAPLMITGVVKLAPSLPFDTQFPFLHLDRKFMHLGFHIYDLGFQSPNVEAARPMIFVTALLLVLIVLVLCSAAIYLRNIMKQRYTLKTL